MVRRVRSGGPFASILQNRDPQRRTDPELRLRLQLVEERSQGRNEEALLRVQQDAEQTNRSQTKGDGGRAPGQFVHEDRICLSLDRQ